MNEIELKEIGRSLLLKSCQPKFRKFKPLVGNGDYQSNEKRNQNTLDLRMH